MQHPTATVQSKLSGDAKGRLPVILLGGPTGVGKTALAIELAVRLETDIVNADSMQVYRFMDIGTAKPTREERLTARHHLLDVVNPDESFDAARYMEMARAVVDTLHREGKVPVIAGGTGLYMKTLISGLCEGAPASEEVRRRLFLELKERGLDELHLELRGVDPELGGKIHPNDRQRILRALEVFRLTGSPLSYWQEQHRFEGSPYANIKVGLFRDRRETYERIDRRVRRMMDQGFLGEAEGLLRMGYGPELKPMQSLGYRHLVGHLLGKISLDAAVHEIQKETRHYAKRQLTWFRGDPEFHWFRPEAGEEILRWIKSRLEHVSKPAAVP